MNLFVLDADAATAAQLQCDKHVVKMSIEYAQLLSTAHHLHMPTSTSYLASIYKPTHVKHPATLWVAAHPVHYAWTFALAESTWNEYTYRYGKVHASSRLSPWLMHVPALLRVASDERPTPPPRCMPVDVQEPGNSWDAVVTSYRRYYDRHKRSFATWKDRPVPDWFLLPTLIA